MPDGTNALKSVLDDFNLMTDYVASIRSPRAPRNLVTADVDAGRTLFDTNGCAGCHGTRMWTRSRVFWTPSEATNASLLTATYVAPALFPAARNPASAAAGRMATLRFSGTNPGANDQINCVLREVGTFPAAGMDGVVPTGVAAPLEVRQNMTTAAQGATGFNPPSLLGLSTGAPYFHAGNARTLEESFDVAFNTHHQAFSENFLQAGDRPAQIRQMVQFLLSIDESTPAPPDGTLGFEPRLCPATF